MMKPVMMTALAASALAMTACQSIPRDMTVAEYCANPDKAFDNVCRLKTEIDGNSIALRDTDMRLSQARAVADAAMSRADGAYSLGNQALGAAAQAQQTADLAYAQSLTEDDMQCETRTLQKTNIGQCRPGYTLMSCTQSRFTYRAGGPSILREIDDEQCRFNDRVLEMKVRCCALASQSPQPVNMTIDRNQPETYPRTEKPKTTPYRY